MTISPCHNAAIFGSLGDGVVIGSCSVCGKMVTRRDRRSGVPEWLDGESPWTTKKLRAITPEEADMFATNSVPIPSPPAPPPPASVTPDMLRGWLRSSDDAYARAVRTAGTLQERLDQYEIIRARLVAERDELRALLARDDVPLIVREMAKKAQRT